MNTHPCQNFSEPAGRKISAASTRAKKRERTINFDFTGRYLTTKDTKEHEGAQKTGQVSSSQVQKTRTGFSLELFILPSPHREQLQTPTARRGKLSSQLQGNAPSATVDRTSFSDSSLRSE